MAKERKTFHAAEASAILLFALALFVFLSLFTLDPKDSPFNVSEPNAQVHNVTGPIGALLAHSLTVVFGLASLAIPLFLVSAGVVVLLGKRLVRWEKLAWASLGLLSMSLFLDLHRELAETWRRSANLSSPGGFLGENLNEFLFLPALGRLGSEVLVLSSLAASTLLLYELHPFRWSLAAFRWVQKQWEAWEEKRLAQNGLAGKLRLAERRILKEKRELEKRLSKEKGVQTRREVSETSLLDLPIVDSTKPTRRAPASVAAKANKPEVGSASALGSCLDASGQPPRAFVYPKLELLNVAPTLGNRPLPEAELREKAQVLLQTLSTFGIEASPGTITRGPTITRFEIYPAPGVRVDRIVSLQRDLARALKAERIQILAPIPGKDSVGVEVPNEAKIPVVLRDLLADPAWESSGSKIPIPLGKDVYGATLIADLTEMPHLLIAGATGSGKSVFLNALLVSLLYRFSPRELRLILVDPKQVELSLYEGLPHLVVPVVVEPKRVLVALRWLIEEMDRRYRILAQSGLRHIASYNRQQHAAKEEAQPPSGKERSKDAVGLGSAGPSEETPSELPYIVLVIDELADLMQATPAEVETAIARLCAKARASGIHLALATQTPRREVVTGVIKANIPCRIAFQVASAIDSRVILDESGAENLLGRGDFLYLPPGSSRWVRGQGAYVSEEEVHRVVEHWRAQGGGGFEAKLHSELAQLEGQDPLDPEDRELINKCLEVVWQERKASTSLLQRRLRLGYNRAAWVMDWLEHKGIVGPENGAKPREVLADLDGPPPKV